MTRLRLHHIGFFAALLLLMVAVGLSVAYPTQGSDDSRLPRTPNARKTHVPCWAPPTLATCTPAPTSTVVVPTNTSTAVSPDTPTAVPPTITVQATATPTPTTQVTVTPSATCSPDPVWSCPGMERAFELETARLINEHRVSVGLAPFEWVVPLHMAEVPWAQEMVANNQCYHGDFGARAIAAGYTGWPWGEIGSCGYENPQAALQGWLDSPGHRAIVEVPDMRDIGVGMAYYPNRYASTWAIVGRRDGFSMEQQYYSRAPDLKPVVGPGGP